MKLKSKYFYGHEVSEYGLENRRVDFATLSKCGDIVLCNDIVNLFYRSIDGEYVEPELVNGYLTDEDVIADLQSEIEKLLEEHNGCVDANRELEIANQISKLETEIELIEESSSPTEIYQYYIISNSFAEILQYWTNEIVFYIDVLNIYVWGVTHYGTGWDYVLTEIELELDDEESNTKNALCSTAVEQEMEVAYESKN